MTAPRNKGLADKLMKGLGWSAMGTGAQAIVRLGTLAVLARILSPTEFGYMAAVTTVVTISEAVSNMGLAPALIQRKEVDEEDLVTAQSVAVLLAIFMTVMVWFGADQIAALFSMPEIIPYVRLASIVFLLHGLTALARARVARDLNFARTAKAGAASALFGYATVALALAWAGFGAWALVWAMVAQAALSFFIFSWYYPPILKFRIHLTAARRLLGFGMGSSASNFLNRLTAEADYVVVGRLMGAEALGIYSRAFQLVVQQTKRIGQLSGEVLFPILSTIQDDPERLRTGYRRAMSGAMFGSALIAVPAWFLSEHAVLLMLGNQWTAAVMPFAWLALGIPPRSANRINGALFLASGRSWWLAGLQVNNLVWLLLSVWIGAQYGIDMVALAVSLAIWLHYLLLTIINMVLHRMPVWDFVTILQPAAIAVGVMTGFMAGAQAISAGLELSFWLSGGALLTAAILSFAVTLTAPDFLLGREGAWMKQYFKSKILKKMNRRR